MRCSRCQKKTRTVSYAGGYCRKCERLATRKFNAEQQRKLAQETAPATTRLRELTALPLRSRLKRGMWCGTYDGLRNAFLLFVIADRFYSRYRGYQPNLTEPRWPGCLWFCVWFPITLLLVMIAYGLSGPIGGLIAYFLTSAALGAMHGCVRAARNQWGWWIELEHSSGGPV